VEIKRCLAYQIPEVITLLKENNLPIQDIDNENIQFYIIQDNARVIAVVGIEVCNSIALLRSLAVSELVKSKGIGKILVDFILQHATTIGIEEIYLLTTNADAYFLMFGFETIDRANIPDVIQSTEQMSRICPQRAIVMKKVLN
jgi:amino-acid N-acetyltransferase